MNFPGRLNKRRVEALNRALKKADEKKEISKRVQNIIDATRAKLMDQEEADKLKTKVNRSKPGGRR
jgi:hypothetical protein